MAASGQLSGRLRAVSRGRRQTFSFFLTRILDQLSISSWLPAITLVCNLALIFQLRSQHNFDFGQAITALAAKPLGILIVLLLSIVVASIVTQAFEFEAIRLLEGYWGSIMLLQWFATWRTRRHRQHLARLETRYRNYFCRAFNDSQIEMLDNKVPSEITVILSKHVRGESLDGHDRTQVAKAKQIGWRRYAPPELLHRMDAAENLIKQYPHPHCILPTKLGNTLRSGEDQLPRGTEEELEEFVYRRHGQMSAELNVRHDQFRSRLNIYCLLTLIFSGLAIVSPVALVHRRTDLIGGAVFLVVYAILALISYQASIASARGYVTVLRVIGSQADASS
jgi:hypothetical protein